MKKQYQIEQQRAVQQFRRIATEQNPNIQMMLPLAEIVGLLQQGVGNLLRETGLALMQAVMEEEVRHRAGGQPPAARRTACASLGQGRWLLRSRRAEGADPSHPVTHRRAARTAVGQLRTVPTQRTHADGRVGQNDARAFDETTAQW